MAHEIRLGERQDTVPTILLCAMLYANRDQLLVGNRNTAVVLQPQVLRRPLQDRYTTTAQSYAWTV